MTSIARHSYKTLDGMRGVAALAVMVYHFRDLLPLPMFKAGYLAVDIFFCLSGFVICHAYEERLKDGLKMRSFVLIRLIRLWPLAALGVVLGALVSAAVGTTDHIYLSVALLGTILLNMAFLPSYAGSGDLLFPLNPPGWSLFYELAINLFYGALVRLLSTPILILFAAVGAVSTIIGVNIAGNANFGWARFELLFGFGRVTCSFFAGVLLQRWLGRRPNGFAHRQAWLPLLLTGLLLTLPVTRTFRPLFDGLFIVAGSPFLVWLGATCRAGERASPWLIALGVLSYPLYALHFPIYVLAREWGSWSGVSHGVTAAVAIPAACAISWLMAKYYDNPLRRWLSARAGVAPSARSRRTA